MWGGTDKRYSACPCSAGPSVTEGRRYWRAIFWALLPLLLCGCQLPGPAGEIDALRVPTHDDIVSVHVYWSNVIWLYDSDQQPVGFQAPVYFVSGQSQRGVFVDGRVHVWMSEVSPGAGDHATLTPLYEWKLDGQAERNFRVRRKVVSGYYYGLRLKWPPDLAVEGKQVELVIGYQRQDGSFVKSLPRRDEVVPARKRRMLLPGAPPPENGAELAPEAGGGSSTPRSSGGIQRFRPVSRRPNEPRDEAGATGDSDGSQQDADFEKGSDRLPPRFRAERQSRAGQRARPPTSQDQTVDEQGRPTVIVRTRLR